jgi:hypothetical protein
MKQIIEEAHKGTRNGPSDTSSERSVLIAEQS